MTDDRSVIEAPETVTPAAPPKVRRKSLIREYGEAIAIAVLLALVIRTLVVQAFTIPSGSMMDTMLVGDYILVNKFLYGPEVPFTDAHVPGLRDPRRGDIIVFKYPQDEKRDFIKRIVAGPGETVQVRGPQVYVNGRPLQESYVKRADSPLPAGGQTYCGYAYGCEPTVVPANGGVLYSAAKRATQKLNWSVRASVGCPCSCSGDMYAGVPMIAPAWVSGLFSAL